MIYLDAGCTINLQGEKRFFEYIDLLSNSKQYILSFQLSHIEKQYTIKEIFEYFNLDLNGKEANSRQIVGGILIMKKIPELIAIINTQLQLYTDNQLLVTDHYSKNQNGYFIDNRHDQSIFSIIRKLNDSILLDDETFFNFGDKVSLNYPFWATRRR